MTTCEACDDRGWLLADPGQRRGLEIQRCDACEKYTSDNKAVEAVHILAADMAYHIRLSARLGR